LAASARSSRIVVHDYSGHPGQAQLSRALARCGYDVTHQHCPSYTTGRGSLRHEPGDPATLAFEPVEMDGTFAKYSALTRLRQELQYGRTAARAIVAKDPAVAVISNVPLLAHAVLARRLMRRGIPMVFWHQDIYSEAIGVAARRRIPVVGGVLARITDRVERTIARRSVAVVAISPTFLERLSEWGVADKTTIVPNWAPIGELPVRPADNAWRQRNGLSEHQVVLYSGTLGLKHDPSILAELATGLGHSHPGARVVVVSEGKGRDWLEEHKAQESAGNLVLLDFQPYEDLPEMMASADLLVAILEPDASKFSVPSKVLTYLCASRAVLGVLPPDNSVAEILNSEEAGVVVDPFERTLVVKEAAALLDDHNRRHAMGRAGRAYAERTFSPETAADQFLGVFGDLVSAPSQDPAGAGLTRETTR
jgi:glycosyltransferase involved in cell wall biosynthesis